MTFWSYFKVVGVCLGCLVVALFIGAVDEFISTALNDYIH